MYLWFRLPICIGHRNAKSYFDIMIGIIVLSCRHSPRWLVQFLSNCMPHPCFSTSVFCCMSPLFFFSACLHACAPLQCLYLYGCLGSIFFITIFPWLPIVHKIVSMVVYHVLAHLPLVYSLYLHVCDLIFFLAVCLHVCAPLQCLYPHGCLGSN